MAEYEEVSRVDTETEEDLVLQRQVKKALEEHDTALKFDAPARKQFAIDRRYAAGRADATWASDANLIGSFIDVLVAFLYARDPDMDCRPAERVDEQPTSDDHAFARTLSLVISRLWKDGRLKKVAKKAIRSSLSVGPGWFKAVMLAKAGRDPQVERDLNDAQENLQRLRATEAAIEDGSVEDREVAVKEVEELIAALEAKVEVIVRSGLAIDFVRAEDIQVSLDVAETSDYLDADFIDQSIYCRKDDLRNRFEMLTDADVKQATCYYQKRPYSEADSNDTYSNADAETGGQFTKGAPGETMGGEGEKAVQFAKIIERWDKRTNLIYTMIDGLKKWAVAPYAPPFSSTRFYPFFQVAMYEVDSERFPQSLSWRLRKLQDEYSTARSNVRRVRERTQPGTIFNASQIDPENARKLENSVGAEYVGIKPLNADADFGKIFAPKPTASINHNLYDTQPILSDMERISGVQEALQSSVQTAKTATEAEIQQSGFASRTDAGRDALEDTLRDLAHYTAEVALQAVPAQQAVKIAGVKAFWPEGMDIEDITTMVNVDIDAGSTGKPSKQGEKETWSIVMPMVQKMLMEIRMLQTIDPGLAEAMMNLLKETLLRLDDRFDIEKIMPSSPPPPPPAAPPEDPPGPGGAPPEGGPVPVPEANGGADGTFPIQ